MRLSSGRRREESRKAGVWSTIEPANQRGMGARQAPASVCIPQFQLPRQVSDRKRGQVPASRAPASVMFAHHLKLRSGYPLLPLLSPRVVFCRCCRGSDPWPLPPGCVPSSIPLRCTAEIHAELSGASQWRRRVVAGRYSGGTGTECCTRLTIGTWRQMESLHVYLSALPEQCAGNPATAWARRAPVTLVPHCTRRRSPLEGCRHWVLREPPHLTVCNGGIFISRGRSLPFRFVFC